MSTTSVEGIPQQANLLACKQWWKVCFLYGDQQKYYRQVYGKAASQRLAMSVPPTDETGGAAEISAVSSTSSPSSLFPIKHPSRRRGHQSNRPKTVTEADMMRPDVIQPNSRVTVLDDPFLFGLNEYANLSEDSGIDNAAFESTTTATNKVRRSAIRHNQFICGENDNNVARRGCVNTVGLLSADGAIDVAAATNSDYGFSSCKKMADTAE